MKKINVIGFVVILLGAIGLVLYRVTGLKLHIAISIIALIAMLACMIVGKKNWKVPAPEILYRAFYLIALITGFVLASGNSIVAIVTVHKIAAAIFAVFFIVSSVISLKSSK